MLILASQPWLKSEAASQIITYDDPQSLGLKATLAKQKGLKGVNIFDASGDTTTWDLTDALRAGLGLQ